MSGNCSVHRDDGWLVSGLGVRLEISFSVGQTEKYSPQQHPLHESGTPLRAIHGQASTVPLAEAGLIENTQQAVHEGGEICQFYEVSRVVHEGAVPLLHAEELDGRDIHPGKNKRQGEKNAAKLYLLRSLFCNMPLLKLSTR